MSDETSVPVERPEIFYVPCSSVSEGLQLLAQRFDTDDDLVLIGLWNIEPPDREYPEAYLQVVVTHLADAGLLHRRHGRLREAVGAHQRLGVHASSAGLPRPPLPTQEDSLEPLLDV